MESLLVNSTLVGAILLGYVSLVFLWSRATRDNSVMDLAYGFSFVTGIGGTMILTGTYKLLPLVIVCAMTLWALRLTTRLVRKNWGKPEDPRYAAWREEWMQKGKVYFILRSFLQVNLLQGFIILLVALPGIIALSAPTIYSLPFLVAGLFVFAFGLGYETTADIQLDRFLARKRAGTEPATLMTTGLFKHSRRPNYFGETLVWWGLAIMVLPLPFGWLALISPLLITFIVTKVTGPMLENIFLERYPDAYREYMRTTNYFVPGPPKS
jgi:steroid 5-alpha reductase family enzyme